MIKLLCIADFYWCCHMIFLLRSKLTVGATHSWYFLNISLISLDLSVSSLHYLPTIPFPIGQPFQQLKKIQKISIILECIFQLPFKLLIGITISSKIMKKNILHSNFLRISERILFFVQFLNFLSISRSETNEFYVLVFKIFLDQN